MPESIPAPLIIDTLKGHVSRGARDQHARAARLDPERSGHASEDGAGRARQGARPARRHLRHEDEANAVAAGLWIGGEPCVLMIQQRRALMRP